MRRSGYSGGKLALGPTVRSFVAHALRREAPGFELVDGAVVTESCRVIKTAKEIGYMDLANTITKTAAIKITSDPAVIAVRFRIFDRAMSISHLARIINMLEQLGQIG